MTTTVTVTTHDWPVEVKTIPLAGREPVEVPEGFDPGTAHVKPFETRSFVVHDGQDLRIHELPSEAEQSVGRTELGAGEAGQAAATA